MMIENLSVTNFRVFSGTHYFDLIPRVKYNKKRPIILYGGLNGAGKTTTLTAVRLVLYGKQSLGSNVSQKDYSDYLLSSIHRGQQAELSKGFSNIELTFSYAHMGVVSHYTVVRRWEDKKGKAIESLSISEDGKKLSELSAEQCQGFLNELIPIGVSELFFFDGEKIAELAEDTKGSALGDSIKKLLGLDVIETLDADLGVFLRAESKKGAVKEIQKQIDKLENELKNNEDLAKEELEKYEQERPKELDASEKLNQLEAQLSSRGGAWAESREAEVRRQVGLSEEKSLIEKEIQELMGGSFPLSIASEYVNKTLDILKNEISFKRSKYMSNVLTDRLMSIDRMLKKSLDVNMHDIAIKNVFEVFSDLVNVNEMDVIHDISESKLGLIESSIADAMRVQKQRVKSLLERLNKINEDLDKAGKNIARAPEEEQIKPIIDDISRYQEIRANSKAEQKIYIENYKRFLREAMDKARELDRLSSTLVSDDEKSRTIGLAKDAKELLKGFSIEIAKRKTKDLESEFIQSFSKLARKEDVDLKAKIDPKTFRVTLLGGDGRVIDKNELSAGEKQIYAISILEALAKTSGRNLPIIIDTPLGRLDSVHREKLIKGYFPTASHQVIILSTDTEVDEEFYVELSPEISHAFKLDYDTSSGSTSAHEGYFWRG